MGNVVRLAESKTSEFGVIIKKGELTRVAILDAALELAARDGLEGLTIGLIADRMQMSKSGVFAHFGSREDLQLEVVREYHRRFQKNVFQTSLDKPKGLPRLERMLELWIELRIHELTSGCIYISGAVEFDDRPGTVRDQLVKSVDMWRQALLKAIKIAIEEGHLRKAADPEAMLFAIYSAILGLHHDARFLKLTKSIQLAKNLVKKIINENKI
jgi:AcrR family transcriptional regulator